MKKKTVKTYLVGGSVRDELLGQPASDQDWVVVGSSPEEMVEQGYKQVGKDFPCFLHPETHEEYALARTERKSGRGYKGFVCEFGPDITLEEDLSRRDLTINAIAKTPEGNLVDPFNGVADLKAGVLRHVSTAFAEDPLRVLRVARFAARFADLGFEIHPDTLSLMGELVTAGEMAELTPERVWKEMHRALTEARPSEFFRVLRRCGALQLLIPEIAVLFGVPQPVEHHPEVDTGDHVMLVIDYARKYYDKPIITWAGLMHDLGKGVTARDQWPKHTQHEALGVPLVEDVCGRFKVPNDYKALAVLATKQHLRCHKLLDMRAGSILKLLEAVDGIRRPQRLRDFVEVCSADARGRLGLEQREYPQARLLIEIAAAAKNFDVAPLIEKGYQGMKLAEQIRQARIAVIGRLLDAYKLDISLE